MVTEEGPGSRGERELQQVYRTESRAKKFYRTQVLDHLNPQMRDFVGRQDMLFVATADAGGECDSTFRAGPPGFIQVLDDKTLAYPEYHGNGVMASLGNITENPHVGLLMMDFVRDLVGLHINGSAQVVEDAAIRHAFAQLPPADASGRRAELWVQVTVVEAYIHCAKHIPRMSPVARTRAWGTDDARRKKSDYFGTVSCATDGNPAATDPPPRRGTP